MYLIKEKLKEYSELLSNEYEIKVIEEKIYELIKGNNKRSIRHENNR